MKYSIIVVAAIGLASAAPTVNQLNRPNGAVARRFAPSSNNGPSMNYVRKRNPQSEGGQSSGNTSGGGSNDGGSNRDSHLSGTTIASEGSNYSQQTQSSTDETLVNPPSTDSESVRSSGSEDSWTSGSQYSQDEYQPITREQRQNLLNNIQAQQQREAEEEEQWRQQRDAITRAASGSAGESSGQSGRPNNGGNNDGAGGAGGGKVSSK